jgi:hypothetical protein
MGSHDDAYLGKAYACLNPLPSYRVFIRVGAEVAPRSPIPSWRA